MVIINNKIILIIIVLMQIIITNPVYNSIERILPLNKIFKIFVQTIINLLQKQKW